MGNAGSSESDLQPGDVICRPLRNGIYYHYGVYVGHGFVVHLTGNGIPKDSFEDFARKRKVTKMRLDVTVNSGQQGRFVLRVVWRK